MDRENHFKHIENSSESGGLSNNILRENRDPFSKLSKSSLEKEYNLKKLDFWFNDITVSSFQIGVFIGAVVYTLFFTFLYDSVYYNVFYALIFIVFAVTFWITGHVRKSGFVSIGYISGELFATIIFYIFMWITHYISFFPN